MARRTERVANLLRNTIGDIIHQRLADPRIDSVATSVTRVEVPSDLLTAKVFVTVMGGDADQRKTLKALNHSAGRIQELMMREISLRHTPRLTFVLDTKFKKTIETLAIIQQAMDEIHEKEGTQGQDESVDTPTENTGLPQ
jgi:ribosome-binding factor A